MNNLRQIVSIYEYELDHLMNYAAVCTFWKLLISNRKLYISWYSQLSKKVCRFYPKCVDYFWLCVARLR